METRRVMFANLVSGSTVELRRHAQFAAMPEAQPTVDLHQVNLVIGNNATATADATFFATGCIKYEVIIRRLT